LTKWKKKLGPVFFVFLGFEEFQEEEEKEERHKKDTYSISNSLYFYLRFRSKCLSFLHSLKKVNFFRVCRKLLLSFSSQLIKTNGIRAELM